MNDIIRVAIKRYLIDKFREILPSSFLVYLNRPMNIQPDSSYLSILSINENNLCFDESPRRYKRTLFLNFEVGFFPSSSTVDEYITEELYFDQIIELVASVLKEDEHINNLVSDSKLTDIQFRTESGAERPFFVANIIFETEYYEDVGLQEILDRLNIIRTQVLPSSSSSS